MGGRKGKALMLFRKFVLAFPNVSPSESHYYFQTVQVLGYVHKEIWELCSKISGLCQVGECYVRRSGVCY